MRSKIYVKLNSPFHYEKKFIYRNIILPKHKLTNSNLEKTISFSKPIESISSIKNLPSSKSQNNIFLVNDIKNGIVSYKFPKLILPNKNNMNNIKVPLSKRSGLFQKKENKLKSNNSYLSLINPENPFYSQLINKNDINDVLGVKKEKSSIIKYIEKKKELDSKKYIQKLGVMKYIEQPILKNVSIGKMDNIKQNILNKKAVERDSKIANLKNRISKIMDKKKFEYKNSLRHSLSKSYEYLLNKKKFQTNKKLEEENEKRVNSMRVKRFSMLKKQIYQFNSVYKEITQKMNNFYNKKRKEFEKFIDNEFAKEEE